MALARARGMSSFAGTVTLTHANIGTRRSGISKRFQTKAKPRGRPSSGSIVHCRVSVLPDGFPTFAFVGIASPKSLGSASPIAEEAFAPCRDVDALPLALHLQSPIPMTDVHFSFAL